jgi:hypothetical protein
MAATTRKIESKDRQTRFGRIISGSEKKSVVTKVIVPDAGELASGYLLASWPLSDLYRKAV